jgi:hypothetical protein
MPSDLFRDHVYGCFIGDRVVGDDGRRDIATHHASGRCLRRRQVNTDRPVWVNNDGDAAEMLDDGLRDVRSPNDATDTERIVEENRRGRSRPRRVHCVPRKPAPGMMRILFWYRDQRDRKRWRKHRYSDAGRLVAEVEDFLSGVDS